jgi:hypothetical protein
LHVQLDRRRRWGAPGDAVDACARSAARRSGSPSALTVTIVSAPTLCLSSAGVSEREDPAVVHDRDAVAELVGLLHVVRGQQDRLARRVELAEDLPQREPALRVEAGGRLVEEQHGGPVQDRARHHEPLRHAAGQRVHRGLGPLGRAGTARAARRRCGATRARRCRRAGRGSRGSPRRQLRSRVFCCETTPMSCLASAGWATTSMPPTKAGPRWGRPGS